MLIMPIAPPETYIYTNPVGRITPTNTGEVIKADGRERDSDTAFGSMLVPAKIRGRIQQFPTVTQHWMVDGHHARIDQIPEME